MREFYLLRWRYDYHDHKPTKYGQWNRHSENPSDQAWCQSKENLMNASIEVKNYYTREIKRVAECRGQDFVNFQWIATASTPMQSKGKVVSMGSIVGLSLVSRKEIFSFYLNGQSKEKANTVDYSKIHLAGFGR